MLLASLTFNTPSSNAGDGTWSLQARAGEAVAVGPAYLYYNLNPYAAFAGYTQGDPLYVKVDYFDEGTGTLRVQYDSTRENFDPTDFHTRSTRIDTQEFVSSHHYLDSTQFANGTNGSDFRVVAFGTPVLSVEISDTPFPDSGLEWAWSPPWERPYSGPSRPVDAATLEGKVLAGYQGWFNTPNDPADEGYVHWGGPGDWSVEQWPDPNDYDASELFPVPGVQTARGEQAYLFSSANASVVDRHFQWMREHDIDGAFVQRFRDSFMRRIFGGDYAGEPQWPVVNARDAAHKAGRTWAIEYDIQNGGSTSQRDQVIQEVKDDWEYLTDVNGLDMLNDSHYQREDGKPVVAIFGLYVGPTNGYSTAQQQDLIDYFQSRGVYVIGAGRHTESSLQVGNAGLHDAYIPWQGYWKGGDSYAPDEGILSGVTTHVPHVFPGFSWTHLQNSSAATSRDREDGDFYWRMLNDAVNETDAPWLFIGMFDEYDEGTNLIPATDDPPVPDTDSQGNPLTYQVSDPRPNDWWMALTGAAKQALQGKAAIGNATPTEHALQNRSNTGGEARWEPQRPDRLANVQTPESTAEIVDVPVRGTVSPAIRSNDSFLYFGVDDSFLIDEVDGRDITIEVEYLDLVTGQFSLEYDGVGSPHTAAADAVMTGSGNWRTHRFELIDARFANRQEGDADFRVTALDGNLLIRRISVLKENALTVDASLGSVNSERGLRQIELAGDGQTAATSSGGRSARAVSGTPESLYMYFNVDPTYANDVHAGLNAVVEVVYQDVGGSQLNLQYDSTSSTYKNATPVAIDDSGEWRTARFYLDDAFFGDRQNGDADFRLTGANVPIDRVRVLQSFGDMIEPELTAGSPMVNTPGSSIAVSWTMTDDWRTGLSDQWTPQEDNWVRIEVSGDQGVTWQDLGTEFEAANGAAGDYDVAGNYVWSHTAELATGHLPSGVYRLRLTPTDGRGNQGESLETGSLVIFAPPELPGDYNVNGVVDAADYTIWRDSIDASVAPFTSADGSGNGLVDNADQTVWSANYGNASPQPVAAALPLLDLADDSDATCSPRWFAIEELMNEEAPPAESGSTEGLAVLLVDAALADQTGGREDDVRFSDRPAEAAIDEPSLLLHYGYRTPSLDQSTAEVAAGDTEDVASDPGAPAQNSSLSDSALGSGLGRGVRVQSASQANAR
ncbi:hypothetical protein Pla123a_11530 [Posidoniimonas polymericola]|uniref:Uncharacterized protein n=1 Tax=Posidoniimonas polymericola TaxID=2528002 RepID=A0A5C5YTM3_9BACT|nr:hypothetical protein Pla123a_11530 [Posidoniimonas polymericola]